MRTALLVPTSAVLTFVACRWPSDVVLYSLLGCVLAFAAAATWWEIHKIRRRRRLIPAMTSPTDNTLASGTQAFTCIRDYWGYSPKPEQVVEEVLPYGQAGWDFAIHIHEGAEQYLGSAQFSSLVERFKTISGVEDCTHEDRELFLVRAKALTADKLREACWAQFMQAARAVYADDKS